MRWLLVARFILEHAKAHEAERFPFIYLDFDRPEIDAIEPLTLLIEATRQLGIEYPDQHERCDRVRNEWFELFRRAAPMKSSLESDRLDLDYETASPDVENQVPSVAPRVILARTIIDPGSLSIAVAGFASLVSSIGGANRPVVLVLDTFEEVQYRSQEHVVAVWNLLEALQAAIPRLRVIVAGRSAIPNRATELLALADLDMESALGYLAGRGIGDPVLASQIARTVGGSPLSLQLAAELALREDINDSTELGISTREFFFFRIDEALIQRQLYKRILGHIHDERVRRLAHPGLVLRRLTPEVITNVLAEPCGLGVLNSDEANGLFAELKREVSLVNEAEDGALVHRQDLRRQMLTQLEADEPEKVRAIHERAVNYYEQRERGAAARAEEIYHRLSLDQERELIDARWIDGAARYLLSSVNDFSGARRAYLASRLGIAVDDDTIKRAAAEDWERITERRIINLIGHGDAKQALELLNTRAERTDTSPLFSLEAKALQSLGNTSGSMAVLRDGIQRALKVGDQRRVTALVLQASDVVLASQGELFGWLCSQLDVLSEEKLRADEKVLVLGRQIALARLGYPFKLSTEGGLDRALRAAFDELTPEILAARPQVGLWAASSFELRDSSRLVRVLASIVIPRANVTRELRELAIRIGALDETVSKSFGEPPGTLARQTGLSGSNPLSDIWWNFLLDASDARLREVLSTLIQQYRNFVFAELVAAFSGLFRAGLGIGIQPSENREAQSAQNNVVRSTDTKVRIELRDALTATFASKRHLEEFLSLRLGTSLAAIVPANENLQVSVFRVIDWAERQGLLFDLITTAVQSNPANTALADVAARLGVSSLVGNLTTLVEPPPFQQTEVWRAKLGSIEAQVCLIEVDGKRYGTGFLIAPDLILTAAPVIEEVYNRETSPARVVLRFDYRENRSLNESKGTTFRLADDWLKSYRPIGENINNTTDLGYALMRVSNSPGLQPIGSDRAEATAALRKWIWIPSPSEMMDVNKGLAIIHYPSAGPLQLTIDERAEIRVNEEGTRIFHTLPTEPGSAGAPYFSLDLQLIGFHIGASQEKSGVRKGFGIPISAVVRDLRERDQWEILASSQAGAFGPDEEGLRREWHPSEGFEYRGVLTPGAFRIDANFAREGLDRWEDWGDLLVRLKNAPNDDDVYLLPSRKADASYRAPRRLKDRASLQRKKALTAEFAEKYGTGELPGFWFYKTIAKDGRRRVHVYSALYDDFLNSSLSSRKKKATESDIQYRTVGEIEKYPLPVNRPGDIQKGRWGGKSSADGRRVTANVLKRSNDRYEVSLQVSATDGSTLSGDVKFHLQSVPAKDLEPITVSEYQSLAILEKIDAPRPFTIGVEVFRKDGLRTFLELDLASEFKKADAGFAAVRRVKKK